jgi:two-component system, chemotaxis family, chemotaxis protein CheY
MADPAYHNLRILIVDDNATMRDLLRRLLASLGVRDIVQASDGNAALESLRMSKFDVVLSDMEMAPMDGIEFTRQVRQSPSSPNPYVPVIMITGNTEMNRVHAARDAGITEFAVKPITLKNLSARLIEIIERPRPFVRSGGYVGPDRRRKKRAGPGPTRRKDD